MSQPTLEPHSLCYTCWVQVVYSLLPTLLFSSCSLWGHPTAAQFPATRSSPGATKSTRTFRLSSPSRRPCGAQLQREFRTCSTLPHICIRHFVIYVINNIRTRFIISFYVICAVIYYSFCCIYVWLDPGTYMITRFMSFCKPGVTLMQPLIDRETWFTPSNNSEFLILGRLIVLRWASIFREFWKSKAFRNQNLCWTRPNQEFSFELTCFPGCPSRVWMELFPRRDPRTHRCRRVGSGFSI